MKNQKTLVLEVKSSKNQNIAREDLRQLDDWVYELSGEEKARKEGLGGGPDSIAMVMGGLCTSVHQHPSPHKGIIVFNGQLGTPFNKRLSDCYDKNAQVFIEKRDFGILPFGELVGVYEKFRQGQTNNSEIWEKLHNTVGIIEFK